MDKVKHGVIIAAVALLLLFALQNMARVELNFLFWTFPSRRFIIILFALAVGFLLGWTYGARTKKTPKNKDDDG